MRARWGKAAWWCGVLGAAVTLLPTQLALAYCQTTTCAQNPLPDGCVPPEAGQCQTLGIPVAWPHACASFSVQVDGSAKQGITAGTVEDLLRLAFDNWQNADCGNSTHPAIRIETYPRVECSEVNHWANAPNQNVWTFRDANWVDADHTADMIALTTVQFLPSNGHIVDVDEEFNSDLFSFSTNTAMPGMDLQSVIQHESGHFLGLAHSFSASATMYFGYQGSVAMRTLDTDDEEGLCSIYPPNDAALENCDAEPTNGFSTKCNDAPPDTGCDCRLGTPATGTFPARTPLLLTLAAFAIFRRRPMFSTRA